MSGNLPFFRPLTCGRWMRDRSVRRKRQPERVNEIPVRAVAQDHDPVNREARFRAIQINELIDA